MLSAIPYLSLGVGLVERHFKYLLFQVQEKVRTVGNYQMGNLDNADISDTLSRAWISLYCEATTSIKLNSFSSSSGIAL